MAIVVLLQVLFSSTKFIPGPSALSYPILITGGSFFLSLSWPMRKFKSLRVVKCFFVVKILFYKTSVENVILRGILVVFSIFIFFSLTNLFLTVCMFKICLCMADLTRVLSSEWINLAVKEVVLLKLFHPPSHTILYSIPRGNPNRYTIWVGSPIWWYLSFEMLI